MGNDEHFSLLLNLFRLAEEIFMRTLYQHILPVLCLLLLLACSSSGPPPTENGLVKIFTDHETAIASLLEAPDNRARRDGLGIKSIDVLPADSRVVHFIFWSKDHFGPGGASKGLAYLEEVPEISVSQLDNNPSTAPPNQGIFYRRIKDHWYVFYQSND